MYMYYIFVLCTFYVHEHEYTCTRTPHTTCTCILCYNSTLLFISLLSQAFLFICSAFTHSLLSTLLHSSLIFIHPYLPFNTFHYSLLFFTEDSTDIALVKSAMATVLQIDVQSKLFIL